MIAQSHCKSLLFAGETVISLYKDLNDTRSHELKTPFNLDQLINLPHIELAVVSDLIETMSKDQATEWLSMLRNCHIQQLILIIDNTSKPNHDWQLADFLAMGLQKIIANQHYQLLSYNIENYRPKHDWLNSRFWANPENYDKYRW